MNSEWGGEASQELDKMCWNNLCACSLNLIPKSLLYCLGHYWCICFGPSSAPASFQKDDIDRSREAVTAGSSQDAAIDSCRQCWAPHVRLHVWLLQKGPTDAWCIRTVLSTTRIQLSSPSTGDTCIPETKGKGSVPSLELNVSTCDTLVQSGDTVRIKFICHCRWMRSLYVKQWQDPREWAEVVSGEV